LHSEYFDFVILKPVFGPQQIQIDLLVTFYDKKSGEVLYEKMQKVLIFVSEYESNAYERVNEN
jgi:hypothetical protein